jgi:putative NADH-flavin reductase
MSRALVGVDAVIAAFGVSGFSNAFQPTDLYSVGARNLLSAMRDAGTRRLLMVSSAAVLFDARAGFIWNRVLRPLMWPMYADFSLMETLVAESEVAWTVVRPPRLIDGPPSGPCQVIVGDRPAGAGFAVTRSDLAAFLLHEVVASQHLRERVVLAPPP